jgi:Interferon-induced transmembrane protein
MTQNFDAGGSADQGSMPSWQPTGNPAMTQTTASPASVSAHWPLAIFAIFFFWPLGIAACVFAARVKPSLAIGDVQSALTASNRVKVFFWITLILAVLWIVIIVAAAANSGGASGT